MLKKFEHVLINGLSVAVPKKEINIFDEAQYYNNDLKKIKRLNKIVGFDKRRVVEEGTTAADLGLCAAKNLISDLKSEKDFDALILVEQREAYLGAMDAYLLHHKLSLSQDCICTNVTQGCVGWVWGLYLASVMIESGMHKKIMLIAADVPSLGLDVKDRNSAPIFGDAGSATIVEYSKEKITSYFSIDTLSEGYDKIIIPANGCRLRFDYTLPEDDPFNKPLFEYFKSSAGYNVNLFYGYMDGDAVFDFTLSEVPKSIKKLISFAGINKDEIELCCLHQANKQIVKTVGNFAGFPDEKVPADVFQKYGNNTMCSIPSLLCEHSKSGHFSNNLYLCSGFGNGLVVGSALLNLSNTKCTNVINYYNDSELKTRNDYINYWKKKVSGHN